MFRASSAHLQEDIVVHMKHMVLSLWEFLVACRYTGTHSSFKLCTYKPPGTLTESDSTICFMCTTVSSSRWALEARNI